MLELATRRNGIDGWFLDRPFGCASWERRRLWLSLLGLNWTYGVGLWADYSGILGRFAAPLIAAYFVRARDRNGIGG